MDAAPFSSFVSGAAAPLAVVLGTNEIASAIAVKLRKAGTSVILSHDPCPPVLRRGMAFTDALYDDPAEIAGVKGRRAESALELAAIAGLRDHVAVTRLQLSDLLAMRRIQVLIDARLKPRQTTPDCRFYVGLSLGLGSNFIVGENCDLAIETSLELCQALAQCGVDRPCGGAFRALDGIGEQRFARAPAAGLWHTPFEIGAEVGVGALLGRIGGASVRAPINGRLCGLARDGAIFQMGAPLAEIDPRGAHAHWRGLDPDGEAIAETTLAAIRAARKKRKRAPRVAPSAL